MPETSGGRVSSAGVCSICRVCSSTRSGSPPVGRPTISRPLQNAWPSRSLRVATALTPTNDQRDHMPLSADSSRNVFSRSPQSWWYSPTAVRSSASSRVCTLITRRPTARARNPGRSGVRVRSGIGGRPPVGVTEQGAVAETGGRAGVTGRAGLVDEHQQGVAVALQPYLAHVLGVPAGFALLPVLPTAARPVDAA